MVRSPWSREQAPGIGRAIPLLFAEEGAAGAVVVARTRKSVDETARMVEEFGCKALPVSADLSAPGGAQEMVAATREHVGRLDSAVNCAGDAGPVRAIVDYSDEEWRAGQAINMDGTFDCMRAEIPLLLDSGGGAIVNVSSRTVSIRFRGWPRIRRASSVRRALGRAAPGGVVGRAIRINTVQPGGTRTGLLAEAIGVRVCVRPERRPPGRSAGRARPPAFMT